jgi:hypothetical protein
MAEGERVEKSSQAVSDPPGVPASSGASRAVFRHLVFHATSGRDRREQVDDGVGDQRHS